MYARISSIHNLHILWLYIIALHVSPYFNINSAMIPNDRVAPSNSSLPRRRQSMFKLFLGFDLGFVWNTNVGWCGAERSPTFAGFGVGWFIGWFGFLVWFVYGGGLGFGVGFRTSTPTYGFGFLLGIKKWAINAHFFYSFKTYVLIECF